MTREQVGIRALRGSFIGLIELVQARDQEFVKVLTTKIRVGRSCSRDS
jgi:hypothetical protein